jgi:hypothetical protein
MGSNLLLDFAGKFSVLGPVRTHGYVFVLSETIVGFEMAHQGSQVKVKVILQLTVSRPVYLDVMYPPRHIFLLSLIIFRQLRAC